jgi:hypothetical protein
LLRDNARPWEKPDQLRSRGTRGASGWATRMKAWKGQSGWCACALKETRGRSRSRLNRYWTYSKLLAFSYTFGCLQRFCKASSIPRLFRILSTTVLWLTMPAFTSANGSVQFNRLTNTDMQSFVLADKICEIFKYIDFLET